MNFFTKYPRTALMTRCDDLLSYMNTLYYICILMQILCFVNLYYNFVLLDISLNLSFDFTEIGERTNNRF